VALTPIEVDKRFKRRLGKKSNEMQAAIASCIRQLRENPHHPSLRTKRVQGAPGVYEARIDRANRLTFHWEGETLVLRNHCNHDLMSQSP